MRYFLAYREANGRDFNGLPWVETSTKEDYLSDARNLLCSGYRDVIPFAVEGFRWDGETFSWEDVFQNQIGL